MGSARATTSRALRQPTGSLSQPIVLVVELWIAPGRAAEFERFETAAASIIGRHGGSIARRIGLEGGDGSDEPDEVHVVTFPSTVAYEAYRADPALSSLSAPRAKAIRRTVIRQGVDLPPFGV